MIKTRYMYLKTFGLEGQSHCLLTTTAYNAKDDPDFIFHSFPFCLSVCSIIINVLHALIIRGRVSRVYYIPDRYNHILAQAQKKANKHFTLHKKT